MKKKLPLFALFLFFFSLLLFCHSSLAFESDELLVDDEEFGLEGGSKPQIKPHEPAPTRSTTTTTRRKVSDQDSDSKIQFSLEHAFGDSDFVPAGTFSARLKTSSHGGQTLTKLRFSRNAFTGEDKEKFEKLLQDDDFYRIRLPSNTVSPPGRDYIISSVKAPSKLSEFRRISLVTSLYKIISKVLSLGLKEVLGEAISYSQGAFVRDRQILDAVLVANEGLEEYRKCKRPGFIFKIDFEKAYDHIDWDFLDFVLEARGFGQKWRSWMRGCLNSVSFSIFLNGRPRGKIHASRVSGLKINLRKSSIVGINFQDQKLIDLASSVGCEIGNWPLKYLGLPLGGNCGKADFWAPVLEKVERRLDGWKKACLSKGGRLTLIQSVLSSLCSYFMSLFQIPVSVAKRIEEAMRDFLWEGIGEGKKDHLVSWRVVSQPQSKGGLGLGNIINRNKALLGKWLWRFPLEVNSLWYCVLKTSQVVFQLAHSSEEHEHTCSFCICFGVLLSINQWLDKQWAPIFAEEVLGENGEGEIIPPPERSFWAKYWMYLIPLGLIVINAVTQAMNMPEEGVQGGGQTQQSAAAIQRGPGSAVRRR
ncbi:reverse transcriptase domain-containing protein [Citrus sinensis]|uniref:Reverse transcriptase domain-containing protein n=1 Tax=Citrus sinensis TaxID=2711 RepID=A0ACB8JNQ1_CITSI|nr:reverse transcriptase domain-containing protein [Citrus sinensis]